MQPDVIIKTLKIGVDPADSSYMPSVIIVSGGTSFSFLEELNAVYLNYADTSVTILSNMARVLHFVQVYCNITNKALFVALRSDRNRHS